MNEFGKIKEKISAVRIRTWTLTSAIVVTLVLIILVNLTTKTRISWTDLILMFIAQVLVHSIYFPDGDIYGQKDPTYLANKSAYNTNASKINQELLFDDLRKFCDVDFEKRKEEYILNELGLLGITAEEYKELQQLDKKQLRGLKSYEFKTDKGSRLILFTRAKRKRLIRLITDALPVEKNYPETIVSAVENNGYSKIKDGSVRYKRRAYIRKVLMAGVMGCVFAYMGYTLKDGIGLTEVVSMCIYLTAIFSTAVLAFSSGENCSKVYKNNFYLELTNFIDAFFEWKGVKK